MYLTVNSARRTVLYYNTLMEHNPELTVFQVFDKNKRPVFVGMTRNPSHRLRILIALANSPDAASYNTPISKFVRAELGANRPITWKNMGVFHDREKATALRAELMKQPGLLNTRLKPVTSLKELK